MAENSGIPKYPKIEISITHLEGNPIAIVAMVRESLRSVFVYDEVIDEFTKEAWSGDYDHLIQTVKRWVTTE